MFVYKNGSRFIHSVFDKFHFFDLLGQIDMDFDELYKFDVLENKWIQVRE